MIDVGGPDHLIQVHGKLYNFEMHPYCGPVALRRDGEPLADQPIAFLSAVTLWAEQGKRVENGLCRWDKASEPILKHIVGRHYKVVGYTEPVKGE